MGVGYRAVSWNPGKKRYDLALALGIVLYLAAFLVLGGVLKPQATAETLLIRALGTGAFLLLHVILCIGPLARLDRRFLPLLYNRRHLGVSMFVLALAHGGFSTFQFHVLGDANPIVSVLTANTRFDSLSEFPFQPLGLIALVILALMAASSHDFWLANLTAPVWKTLHLLVYVAYALLVLHVVLGVLQVESSPLYPVLLGAGMVLVLGLHVAAALRERALDEARDGEERDGFVDAFALDEIPEGRARILTLSGDRIAVFRYDGKVAAVSNACQHQNGPLGEGRVIDGCITCPWHGYQYRPEDGQSPPPFTEKVPTFRVRIEAGRVLVDPRPLPAGTPVEPAREGAQA
jgi:nitrite reductase/ring-hydroxylating ferredoxin subunit